MRVIQLQGLDDSRFVDRDLYRDIARHERLRARGLFVAEGRLVVSRLIERHACLVRSLLLNAAAHVARGPAYAALGEDVTGFVCEARDFEELTGHNIHRGCLALASRPSPRAVVDVT